MEGSSAAKYRRLREIGRGAYGMIYLAEITNLDPADEENEADKYVALKKLLTNVLSAIMVGQDGDRVQFDPGDQDPQGNEPSQHHPTEGCVCREQDHLPGYGLYGERLGQDRHGQEERC